MHVGREYADTCSIDDTPWTLNEYCLHCEISLVRRVESLPINDYATTRKTKLNRARSFKYHDSRQSITESRMDA